MGRLVLVLSLAAAFFLAVNSAGAAVVERPLGGFSNHGDVGAVSRSVAASYDAATKTYAVGASGRDIWGAEDAFGFVWKQVEGDVAIAADVALLGSSAEPHRKAGLMFRQSLAASSTYADVVVHGDGHVALQFRSEPGGPARTIEGAASAPKRVRLEKRGAYVTLSFSDAEGRWVASGCSTRLEFDGPFYVGLAVTAHDDAAFETATFKAVELSTPPPRSITRGSALEIVELASLDRRVIHSTSGKMEAPHFSADGKALYYNHEGRIKRVPLDHNEAPTIIDTGFATRCINDHGLSPDGTQLVISDLTETGKSRMYLLPVGGGTPKRVEAAEPALWHGWSPDGKTLTYCAQRDGNYDVYTIPVEGGAETRLTTAPGNDNGPDYSADGKWIYYHSVRENRVQVWRIHVDGTNPEQVTNDDFDNWFPHPSPDGKWILVLSTKVALETGHPPDGDYVLRLLPVGGGEAREIVTLYGGNGSLNVPCWSRDSTKIAYASYEPPAN